MNKLFQSIGYPKGGSFDTSKVKFDEDTLSVAEQNKVASLYVANCDLADNSGSDTTKQIKKWERHPSKLAETVDRFYKIVDRPDDFIVVKSRYGFPADCSDIDIFVDSPHDVSEIVSKLPENEYEVLGLAPTAATVRDTETNQLVDIQTDFGLHNIIYFDDNIVVNNKVQANEFQRTVFSINRGADIALHINHSITELMFTLKEYYTSVYFLETCSAQEFQTMVESIESNRTGYGASVFFGLVLGISNEIFGETPPRASELTAKFDPNRVEFDRLRQNDYITPHKYGMDTLLRYTISRLRQPVFLQSMGYQMINMLDPRTAYYFTSKFYERATRDHYMR